MVPAEDLSSQQTQHYLRQHHRVVVFYTIRLLLAPLVETFILLDRAIYLDEYEISNTIISLFDPITSPRCHALIAIKS